MFGAADGVILLVLIGFAVWGWHGGLIRTGYRLGSFVISIVLSCILYPIFAEYLRSTAVYDTLFAAMEKQWGVAPVTEGASASALQEALTRGQNMVVGAAAEYLTRLAVNVIAFMLVLVTVKVLLWVVKQILHVFTSLPVISFLNRLAGMALGVLEGALVVCLILAAAVSLPPLQESEGIQDAVTKSYIARTVSVHNPLLHVLMPKSDTP